MLHGVNPAILYNTIMEKGMRMRVGSAGRIITDMLRETVIRYEKAGKYY